MIKEDYVSFEIAKLLKENGFDNKCRYVYMHDGRLVASQNFMEGESSVNNDDIESVARYDNWNNDDYAFLCPTLQMVMKWLREKYNKHIVIDRHYYIKDKKSHIESGFTYSYNLKEINSIHAEDDFKSYEEACGAAIKYLLENLI